MRNFQKMAEEGMAIRHKHSRSNFTINEFQDLVQEAMVVFKDTGDTYEVITRLLDIGVSMGYKLAKNEAKASKTNK